MMRSIRSLSLALVFAIALLASFLLALPALATTANESSATPQSSVVTTSSDAADSSGNDSLGSSDQELEPTFSLESGKILFNGMADKTSTSLTQQLSDTKTESNLSAPSISLTEQISGSIVSVESASPSIEAGGQAVFTVTVRNTSSVIWEPTGVEIEIMIINKEGRQIATGWGADALPFAQIEPEGEAKVMAYLQVPQNLAGKYEYMAKFWYDSSLVDEFKDSKRLLEIRASQDVIQRGEATTLNGGGGQAVDIVFAMDTSGSMNDEFSALCSKINDVVSQLQTQGITVRYRILGITATRDCATSTVSSLVPGPISNHVEDWGPATYDLSNGYAWEAGFVRLVIPISDEGPEDGNPCSDPGSDRDSITNAIAAAQVNNVRVAPILGSWYNAGDGPCITELAEDLADGTGGTVFFSTDPGGDLAQGIISLIGNVVASSFVEVSPTEIMADGIATAMVTVTVRDENNNLVAGRDVRLISSRGHLDQFGAIGGTTGENGRFVTTLRSTAPGTVVIRAEDLTADNPALGTASIEFLAPNGEQPPPANEGPVTISGIKPKNPLDARYLEGIPVSNRIDVTVDWKGSTPGRVDFILNGVTYSESADSHGAGHTFNMGTDLQAGQNHLRIVAYNASGEASNAKDFTPVSVPLPVWVSGLQQAGVLSLPVLASGNLGAKSQTKASYEIKLFSLPAESINIQAPGFGVPHEETGIKWGFDGKISLPLNCQTPLEGKLSASAGNFKFLGTKIKVEGHGGVRADHDVEICRFKEPYGFAGIDVEAKRNIYSESAIIMLAYLEPTFGSTVDQAITWAGLEDEVKKLGELYIDGKVNFGADTKILLIEQSPYFQFSDLELKGGIGIEGGLRSEIGNDLETRIWVGADGTIKFIRPGAVTWPPTDNWNFDKITLKGEVGAKFRYKWFEGNRFFGSQEFNYEETAEVSWEYPPTTQLVGPLTTDDVEKNNWALIPHITVIDDNSYAVFNAQSQIGQLFSPDEEQQLLNTSANQTTSTNVLISNVYTYTEPTLAIESATGKALLVWVHDDLAKPIGQSHEIEFSYWDGNSWTIPAHVTDDDLLDGAPKITWAGDGQAIAVWERVTESLPITASWNLTTAKKIEIATAVYSSTTGTWSPPSLLTNNNALDVTPQLVSNSSGQLLAVWRQNDAGRLTGNSANPDQIMAAFYDQGWNAPSSAVADIPGILDLNAGYGDEEATVVFTRYMTPTGQTTPTLQLFTSRWDGVIWSNPVQFTNDALNHRNPQVLYNSSNQPLLVWLAGDDLSLSNMATGTVVSLTLPTQIGHLDEFTVVQDGAGNLAVVFTAQRNQRDVYVAFYDQTHALWGSPTRLTNDQASEGYLAPALDSTGRLLLGYAATAMTSITRTTTLSDTGEIVTYTIPAEGQTDLVTLSHVFTRNLTLADADFVLSDDHPAPSSSVVLSATVRNSGDLAVSDVEVNFYDGNPTAGGTLIGHSSLSAPLAGGFTTTLTTTYSVPFTGGPRNLYAVADPSESVSESNETDNTASLLAFGPDLELAEAVVDDWGGRDVGLVTFIRNLGTTTAPTATISFYQDGITGTLLVTDVVPALAVGQAISLTTSWNHEFLPEGEHSLTAVVNQNQSDFAEATIDNNNNIFTLAMQPDLAVDPLYFWSERLPDGRMVITGTIYNFGSITATNVVVGVYANELLTDTGLIFSDTIASLPPLGYATITGFWETPQPSHNLYLWADPDRLVTETTKVNNLASMVARFELDVEPSTQTIMAGLTESLTVTITSLNAFLAPTSLSVNGLPDSFDVVITPNPITPPGNASIVITPTIATPAGIYLAEVEATGGGITQSIPIILEVQTIDLSVSKSLNSGQPFAGTDIQYRIHYANQGDSAATDVVITDSLPLSMTYVSESNSAGFTSSVLGKTVVWSKSVVAAGESGYLYLTAHIDESALPNSPLTNTVEIANSLSETDYSDNQSTYVTNVLPRTRDMRVSKSLSSGTPVAGAEVQYRIYVRNDGNSDASNIVITDTLPISATYVSDSNSYGFTTVRTGETVVWTKDTVAAGQTAYIYLTVRFDDDVAGGEVLTNTVAVATSDVETDYSDNIHTYPLTAQMPSVDMYVSKWLDAGNVTPGNLLTYEVYYRNYGNSSASDVIITDTLPVSTTYVSYSGAYTPTLVGNQLVWNLGTVAGSGYSGDRGSVFATLRLSEEVPVGTVLTNTAEIATNNPETDYSDNLELDIRSVVAGAADLRLYKYFQNSAAPQGSEVTYRLSYVNNSNDAAVGVILTDTLPISTTYVSSTGAPEPTVSGNQVSWNLPPIPGRYQDGYSDNIYVTVYIAENVPVGTELTNTAVMTASNESNPTNNADDDVRTVTTASRDLYIDESFYSGLPLPGNEVTYRVYYRNYGNAHLPDTTIVNTLPAGTTFVSASGPVSPVVTGNTVVWNLGTLPGASASGYNGYVYVTVRIPEDMPLGTILRHRAVGSTSATETGTQRNDDQSGTTVQAITRDVRVVKTLSSGTPQAGHDIIYRLRIYNDGNSPVANVRVTDTLPLSTSYVSWSGDSRFTLLSTDSGQVVWLADELPGNFSSDYIYLTVHLDEGLPSDSDLVNQLTASTTDIETDYSDNLTTYALRSIGEGVDLTLSKRWGGGSPLAGSTLTYRLDYANRGTQSANNVVITDTLPPWTTFNSTYASGWSHVEANGVITWTRSTLNGNSTGYINLTVRLSDTVPAETQLTNQASISSSDVDINPTNNTATHTISVASGSRDLRLDKSLHSGSAAPGNEITYRLYYRNHGSSAANNVVVTDTLPDGLSFVSASGSVLPTVTGNQVVWQLGTVPGQYNSGYSGNLYLTVRVDEALPVGTLLTNAAEIVTSDQETGFNSNSDTVAVTVQAATRDMRVSKYHDQGNIKPGNEVIYRIYYSNEGTRPADHVIITDTLPFSTTYVTFSGAYTPTVSGNQVIWELGTLPGSAYSGSDGNLYVTVHLHEAIPVGTLLTNGVEVATSSLEADYDDNNDFETGTVSASTPDLRLTKSLQGALAADSEVTYRLYYRNYGSDQPAAYTVLSDTLPNGLTFRRAHWWPSDNVLNAIPITPTIVNNTLYFDLGTILGSYRPNYYGSIYVTAHLSETIAPVGTSLTNQARITTPLDTNSSNDASEHSGTVVSSSRDLYVQTYRYNSLPIAGTQYQYRLSHRNYGNASLEGVVLTQTLPLPVSFVSAEDNYGRSVPPDAIQTHSTGQQILVWNLGTVPGNGVPGYDRTYYVTVALDPNTPLGTTLVNEVQTKSTQTEAPDNYQNYDSVTDNSLVPVHDLSISKSIYNVEDNYLPGTRVTWRLSYDSDSNVSDEDVVIIDSLPLSMTYDTAYSHLDTAGWTRVVIDNIVTWRRDELSANAAGTLYVSAIIAPDVAPTTILTNTAQITAKALTGLPDTATHLITVQGPKIEVMPETLDLGVAYAGYSIQDVLEVSNIEQEILNVSEISADSPLLTLSPTSLSVSSGETDSIIVTYNPTQTGTFSATITLTSNDVGQPIVRVPVSATVIEPPLIRFAPDAIMEVINQGQSRDVTLTITNAGASDLDFTINPTFGTNGSLSGLEGLKTYWAYQLLEPKVLVLQDSYPWGSDGIQQILAANNIPYDQFSSSSIASLDLTPYKVIIIPSVQGNSFCNTYNTHFSKFETYVNDGGILELHGATQGGCWLQLPGGVLNDYNTEYYNYIAQADHPLVEGLSGSFYGYSASHNTFSNYPADTTVVATAGNSPGGAATLIEYEFGFGVVLASGQTLEHGWATGFRAGRILENAIPYAYDEAIRRLWLRANPTSGTVPLNSSKNITVTLDTTELISGTYNAALVVGSNDPAMPEVTVPITLQVATQPPTVAEINFNLGWNNFSLPLEPSTPITSAESLCNAINSQGGSVTEINRWHNAGWDGHVCGMQFNNFSIELGASYFVRTNGASTWSIEGTAITSPIPLNLQIGWNAIGIPHTDAYTAESLCQELINEGVTALEIDRWHESGWDGHICGLPFNDFNIESGVGYFVKASSSGTVSPDAPAVLLPAQTPSRSPLTMPVGEKMPVRDLRLSNLTDSAVTLSWQTDGRTTGYVLYGETPELGQVAGDVRGAAVEAETHLVTLTNLKPETSYYFKVVSGAEDESAPETFTTAPSLENIPASDTVYGQVFLADRQTPATGSLVYLRLQDHDGVGSTGSATLLSAVVDEEGYWQANLGNARAGDLLDSFSYSASGDELLIEVQGAGTVSLTVDTANDAQAPDMILTNEPTSITVAAFDSTSNKASWLGIALAALTLLAGVVIARRRL